MVTALFARLILALLVCGVSSTAFGTGEFIQEIRFFSRSGMDPVNDLPYFHDRLEFCALHSTTTGCLPPTVR